MMKFPINGSKLTYDFFLNQELKSFYYFFRMTDQFLLVESLLSTVHIVAESAQPVVQNLHMSVQDGALQ
jgi:hypothetical protein